MSKGNGKKGGRPTLNTEGSGTRKGERKSGSLTHPRFARMGSG